MATRRRTRTASTCRKCTSAIALIDTRSANRYLKRIRYGNRTPYLPELSGNDPGPHRLAPLHLDGSATGCSKSSSTTANTTRTTPKPRTMQNAWPVRNDPFSSYRAGFEVRTYRLCQRVLMFHHFPDEAGVGADCLVRSTDFTYSARRRPDRRPQSRSTRFCCQSTQSGYRRTSRAGTSRNRLPPLEFEYSEPTIRGRRSSEVDRGEPREPALRSGRQRATSGSIWTAKASPAS